MRNRYFDNIKKYLLGVICVVITFSSYGQKELFYPHIDSIRLNYRSGGYNLDAIDKSFIGHLTLRPGAGFENLYERNLANHLFYHTSGLNYSGKKNTIHPKFSGLPYLGFKYAFGSSLTQDLNVEYHQFYSKNTHFHLRYKRQSSNGLLRNGAYKLNDLSMRLFHSKGWWTTNFDGYYGRYDMGQNGGITTDSLLKDFATLYTPVREGDANSKVRKLNLKWDNYFRLIGDSLVSTGLTTHHHFKIVNREYANPIIDPTMFDTLYLDTLATRDQYQNAGISNGVGIYFKSPYFTIDGTVNYKYRKFQNSGKTRDTSEVFLHSNLWTSFGPKIDFNNTFYFNIIGATGELKEHAKFRYELLPKLTLKAAVRFENMYPTPFQRQYTSNYYHWKIKDLEMQQKLLISGDIKWGDTNFIGAEILWTSINNGRYFIDNQWRQDTLKIVTLGALKLYSAIHLGKFAIYPTVSIRFNSSNFSYQPIFSTMNRFSYTSKLFKAKKLGFAIGVDVGYETQYATMLYNGVLGLMSLSTNSTKMGDLLRLNAFLSLAIDQFRFFVKAENLSSLFNNPTLRIDPNYPIMPFVIRIGITWDFFN